MIEWYQRQRLRKSMEENNCNEVAFYLGRNLNVEKIKFGSDIGIELGFVDGINGTMLHNHPRNSSFSDVDVLLFLRDDMFKTITIVKNNGHIETLSKLVSYSLTDKADELERRILKKAKQNLASEKLNIIKKLLEKSKVTG